MSTIIDYTYFTGKISLPQTANTEGRTTVTQFIETCEPEYLKKTLGYELWKAFTEGIAGSGTPDQRWVDLLEGKDFQYNDRSYSWAGFVAMPSPIAQYVYYWYMENKATDTTLVGPVVQTVDNNARVNAVRKMIDAWNEMVRLNRVLYYFLSVNKEIYPEWSGRLFPYWYDCNEMFNSKNEMDL